MARTPRRGGDRSATPNAGESTPKTTRVPSPSRRRAETSQPADLVHGRRLDAMPDRIDIRDWPYRPHLGPLPDQVVNCDLVPMILDQGREGACTGFALAAVINYLLARRLALPAAKDHRRGQPAHALRDGATLRRVAGRALRGLVRPRRHAGLGPARRLPRRGVADAQARRQAPHAGRRQGGAGSARRRLLPRHAPRDPRHARRAVGGRHPLRHPDGARRLVRPGAGDARHRLRARGRAAHPDLAGDPAAEPGRQRTRGRASSATRPRASSSRTPGARAGAAAASRCCPTRTTCCTRPTSGRPSSACRSPSTSGNRATSTPTPPRACPAPPRPSRSPTSALSWWTSANNGELSLTGDYWTTEDDLARLFAEIIPEATKNWERRRVMLYLHGGLNDERMAARRIIAFRDVLLTNGIYPLHIMWESGAVEIHPPHHRGLPDGRGRARGGSRRGLAAAPARRADRGQGPLARADRRRPRRRAVAGDEGECPPVLRAPPEARRDAAHRQARRGRHQGHGAGRTGEVGAARGGAQRRQHLRRLRHAAPPGLRHPAEDDAPPRPRHHRGVVPRGDAAARSRPAPARCPTPTC